MIKIAETRKFEAKESNIEEFEDKVVEITNVKVEEGDNMSITELTLKDGTIISTTSEVIKKQAQKEAERGLPVTVKIVSKKGKKYNYYTFAEPEGK